MPHHDLHLWDIALGRKQSSNASHNNSSKLVVHCLRRRRFLNYHGRHGIAHSRIDRLLDDYLAKSEGAHAPTRNQGDILKTASTRM